MTTSKWVGIGIVTAVGIVAYRKRKAIKKFGVNFVEGVKASYNEAKAEIVESNKPAEDKIDESNIVNTEESDEPNTASENYPNVDSSSGGIN